MSQVLEEKQVLVEKQGHILFIKLNRPQKYNALSMDMYHALGRAFALLNDDADLRVAVLHAEGKHFTAGVELDQWAETFGSGKGMPTLPDEVDPFGLKGERHRKPVVIAVQGYCYTWGVEILLNTEIRVAARDAKFAMLEVKRGLYPCCGATLRLPKELGWANAQRYLLTGDTWTAEDAHRFGMVQEVTEPGEQLAKAVEIAEKIAKAAPMGVQGALKNTRISELYGEQAAIDLMYKDLMPVMRSEDAKEGVQSFLERREARFTGK